MITSFSNPTIKKIRKLTNHKERATSGLFLIEGLRIVAEAIQCDWKIDTLIYAPDLLVSEFGQSLIHLGKEKIIPTLEVSKEIFMTFSKKDGPQGIAAVVHQRWSNLNDIFMHPGEVWVALESVQNPGNLGSIMRTAEAIGSKGIILLDHSTDPYDPIAIKASMGAIFSLQLIKTDYKNFLDWKSQFKIPLIGTSDKAPMDYLNIDYPEAFILLMGSEREGLSEVYLDQCDQIVRIPMQGRSDSLNLAIATSIILYQIFNQKRLKNINR